MSTLARHPGRPVASARIAPRMRAERPWDTTLDRDCRTLVKFVAVYCQGQADHGPREAVGVQMPTENEFTDRGVCLCPACRKLLTHALVKRSHCRQNPKPQCKHCPSHCYAEPYRRQIREAMKFAGRKLLMQGRVDYLLHLLF